MGGKERLGERKGAYTIPNPTSLYATSLNLDTLKSHNFDRDLRARETSVTPFYTLLTLLQLAKQFITFNSGSWSNGSRPLTS